MNRLLPILFVVFFLQTTFSGNAQVTKLSNNTNFAIAIPLGNMAVLVTKTGVLWRTDGTAVGTVNYTNTVIMDDIGDDIVFNNKIFFRGSSAEGSELWVTDGTAAGTQLVKDINPGAASSDISEFIFFNNAFYFSANDGTNGRELWKSDGTTAGTIMLKDINTTGSSNPIFPYGLLENGILNGSLLFVATDGTSGNELWKTDGTPEGTVLVKDIWAGSSASNPSSLTKYGSVYLFAANDGAIGSEIWRTDGTTEGTYLVKYISSPFPVPIAGGFTVFAGKAFFDAFDVAHGYEGWVTDGTTGGTVLLKDISPGPSNGIPLFLSSFFINGQMLFSATTAAEGNELWSSDGTSANTNLFKDINPGTGGSDVVFFPNLNLNSLTANSLHSNSYNGFIYFRAKTANEGNELWKTDGTLAGTVMVKDLYPGSGSSLDSLFAFVYTKDKIYFTGNDGATGYELWQTDGSAANTTQVIDLNPGSADSKPHFIGYFNGVALFTADDGDNANGDRDLYRLNGTVNLPLPLKLLQFDATPINKSVQLHWTTASEINTASFELEKSSNGQAYEKIGNVAAQGTSTDKKEYQYTDVNGFAIGSKLYYRLKMLDNDGKFTYSNVIAVSSMNESKLVIYPNPVKDEFNLLFNSGTRKQLSMNIVNAAGKRVYDQTLSGAKGTGNYRINVAAFAKGVYYLNLVTDQGIETTSLIKN